MSQPTCETCRFWEFQEGDTGECRKYPPTFASTSEQQSEGIACRGHGEGLWLGWFPETSPGTWRGEHQPISESSK